MIISIRAVGELTEYLEEQLKLYNETFDTDKPVDLYAVIEKAIKDLNSMLEDE
jgi:23S rRNA pseudoU1915 N3-methylase RlmH